MCTQGAEADRGCTNDENPGRQPSPTTPFKFNIRWLGRWTSTIQSAAQPRIAAAQARTDAQQKSCERVHPVPHDSIGSESPTKTSEALAGVRSGRGLGFFSRTSNDVLDVTIQLGCDINPLIMTPTPQLTRVLKPALRRG